MVAKTEAGRLLESGVMQIHELRDSWELKPLSDGTSMPVPKPAARTLEEVARLVGVTLGTVQAVCKGTRHADLHPSRPLFWEIQARV